MFTQHSFYKSKNWEDFRKTIIDRDTKDDGFVYCALCGKPIVRKYDLIVDHIIELNDLNVNDYSISLNPDNVRCMHFICHNERHKRFGFGNSYVPKPKRVYIVYGAPCSGKTTYVKEHAGKNDIVVDMDSIYEMISVNDRYDKPERLKGTAFDLRDALYDIIKYRKGKWENAYIITGGALSGDRQRLKERVNADDFIFIDVEKSICLARAKERGKEWSEYINEWYKNYQM